MMNYWLFKSEPSCFGIEDLRSRPKRTEHWDGVRNFQVRNMLRDEIKEGDLGFFYHSSCDPAGVAGTVKVVKRGYADFTAQDSQSEHYDVRSTPQKPLWYMVDVQLVEVFEHFVPLSK